MPTIRANGLVVVAVAPGCPAAAAGIRERDVVVSVDGVRVMDELDFRYRLAGGASRVGVERDGVTTEVHLAVDDDGDSGLEFADVLADGTHQCNNRCVFCFIHQMPRGMRRSLYVRDDDYRLSFLFGHYITLTNMTEEEFARVCRERMSPLYVSVHATDPSVRARMLGRGHGSDLMHRLRTLAASRVDVHAQVVLCPGWNDGATLQRTVDELADLHPARTGLRAGVQSMAIVPVGLTRFRDRLTRLRSVTHDEAVAMLGWARKRGTALRRELGTRFVWLSDEWYYLSGAPIPSAAHYEGFPQFDDGVGTTRVFLDQLRKLPTRLVAQAPRHFRAILTTGELAYGNIAKLAEVLSALPGVQVRALAVANEHFGGTISVAGLLTGADIARAVGRPDDGSVLCVPSICLNDGRFLDDWTPQQIEAATGLRVVIVAPSPSALAAELGLLRQGPVQ